MMKVPAHPIPNMQNIIRDLRQAKYLTSIDIMDAFMCMELDEESKKYTAFVTEEGLWEWNVCSFGLASFPGEFQSRMNKVFQVDAPSLQEVPFHEIAPADLRKKFPKYMVTMAYPYVNGTPHVGQGGG